MTKTYGFIGLGHLGAKMAGCLLRAKDTLGHELVVYDINNQAVAELKAKGAKVAHSVTELADAVTAVITCLPSPKVSDSVLTELVTCQKPLTWIETSTIDRESVLQFDKKAKAVGINLLECPVTGGVHLAEVGKVTMLVGGDKKLFEQHAPVLNAIASRVFFMGPVGSAAIIKVITNMLAFIHLVSSSEALILAKKGGLDLATAYEAIRASSGNSFVHETEGQLILNGSYDIDFTMDLALKDLGFALNFGKEFGVPLNLAAVVAQKFIEGKAAYGGSAQSTQIAKLWEDLLKTDLRAKGYPAKLKAE